MTNQQYLLHLSSKKLLGAATILGLMQIGGLTLMGGIAAFFYYAIKNPPNFNYYSSAAGNKTFLYHDDDYNDWDD